MAQQWLAKDRSLQLWRLMLNMPALRQGSVSLGSTSWRVPHSTTWYMIYQWFIIAFPTVDKFFETKESRRFSQILLFRIPKMLENPYQTSSHWSTWRPRLEAPHIAHQATSCQRRSRPGRPAKPQWLRRASESGLWWSTFRGLKDPGQAVGWYCGTKKIRDLSRLRAISTMGGFLPSWLHIKRHLA